VASLARAFIAEIGSDPEALEELCELIGPMINSTAPGHVTYHPNQWLDTKQAAAYLGMTVNALHKYTSARSIRFYQDVPGGKCWFKRSELDAWRTRS
jgi:excisionase family DNA binding protein